MPFFYVNGDTKFDLEDLPVDRWIAIEQATGLKWHQVLAGTPMDTMAIAKAVIGECAAETGTTPPAINPRTVFDLLKFEPGENRPDQYDEGVPDPKATGSEPATT